MRRKLINKAKEIECKICNEKISSYNFSAHIKTKHKDITIDEYVQQFDEFRKNKIKVDKKRQIKKIICEICKKEFPSVGFFCHLRDSHGISQKDYIKKYGEYRRKYLDYEKRSNENNFVCLICDNKFASNQHLAHHIRIKHRLSMISYVKKYIFKNEIQYCKCGCGQKVSLCSRPPFRSNYISGHNPNPMSGKHHLEDSKNKMSNKAINRISKTNKYNTKPELNFIKFLQENNTNFIHQLVTDFGLVDFYLPDLDLYIEIDGEYWHPDLKENLNFRQLSNFINEFKKNNLSNLIRIKAKDIVKLNNFGDIERNKYDINFTITYHQKIISSSFFRKYKEIKGEKKLQLQISLLLKFIKTFQPDLPQLPEKENLQDITQKIYKYDTSKLCQDNIFSNNCSTIGTNYLKSTFNSFWDSKFKRNESPREAWKNDKTMYDVIKYRIGLNNSNEVFDFSLANLVRGLSARRIIVSFFKPILAAAIYEKILLNNRINPILFDPCCGFGGRLLGFKSKYPTGTYIGCEPNIDTYNELLDLINKSNFSNCFIHNCKFEDFDISNIKYDVAFTSIPYFDLEIYDGNFNYESLDDWKNKFINKLLQLKNTYIVLPEKLYTKLSLGNNIWGKIKSNKSHFSKENKIELIIKTDN